MSKFLSVVITVTIFVNAVSGYVLQPAISPDGDQIAFCYQGDIWSVSTDGGRPYRLTVHEGYDSNPRWSADGDRIAFQSDRYGNNDIFSMSKEGSKPVRHTYHSASDILNSYSPDGSILFQTRRVYAQVEREHEVYRVDEGVGTPSRFMEALGFDAVTSPDGSKVAFVRGSCRREREDYRGPANADIWVWDIEKDEYKQITDFEGNDYLPKWLDDSTLLFLSSRKGKYNVFQSKLSGSAKQLTFEKKFGVNSFDLSSSARKVVYQYGDRVSLLDLDEKNVDELDIELSVDFRFDPFVSKTVKDDIDEYAVSPDGKLSAYIVRGDVFITRNDKDDDRSVRITNRPSRERHVTWLNDEAILYVSDQEGQYDLYLTESDDDEEQNLFKTLKTKTKRLTETPDDEFQPSISPDGKRILYRIDNSKLVSGTIDPEGTISDLTRLLDGWARPEDIAWSPDSLWIAYSLPDLNYNAEVYIHPIDNATEPVNVSMHPRSDGQPVWSPDGSKLGFLSERNNGDSDVWFVWLKKSDWQKTDEQWARERKEKDDKEKKESPEKASEEPEGGDEEEEEDSEEEEEEEVELVEIDLDRMYQRLVQVTSQPGNEGDFAFDKKGEMIYFTIGSPGRQNYKLDRNLFKVRWDGEDLEGLIGDGSAPGSLQLTAKGDFLYMLAKGGQLRQLATKSDKVEKLSVSSQIQIRSAEENEQIYHEAWRALNKGFYDPQFHGYDFEALRDKYLPLARKASTPEDFQFTFNLMLGQLNASHMGMRNIENPKDTQTQTSGLLGIEGVNTSDGFQVTHIVPNSPLVKASNPVEIGDVIQSIDQSAVTLGTNIFSLLMNRADNPVLLQVKRGEETLETILWPTSTLSSENYDAWVEGRRELVDEYSDGKLGYLHIQGMNWGSFERFETELVAAGHGKDGIVIDVRYNGGGWTTDYLMAVLNVKQHSYTIPRGATSDLEREHRNFKNNYPFGERLPFPFLAKPSIAICNENSYSNAEIFSHAYKGLKLGKLVGQPTFGAVISTGSYGLLDGSYVRMPLRAWYVKGTETGMEHHPAVPNILVENPPAYKAKGVDPQLKRAVDELLKQVD